MCDYIAVKTQCQIVLVSHGPTVRAMCHQQHFCQTQYLAFTELQKSEETCSHYRKWLSAVAECAKALTDSKAQVVKAEADVKVTC